MTWRWNRDTGLQPLPGIGEGPFEDDEFEARVAAYVERHGCKPEAVTKGIIYTHTPTRKRRRGGDA